MSIDTTEIGIVAAKVMEDLEEMQKTGDVEDDARVMSAIVIYEIQSLKESTSTVGCRITNDSSILGLGLMERMKCIILNMTTT